IFFLCILSAAGQGLTKVSQLLQQFLQCQLLSVAIKKNFALHSCNDIFYFSQTQQNSQDFECHPEVCIVLCCTVRKYIVNSQQRCIVIFALVCCFAILVALIFSAVDIMGEDEDGLSEKNCQNNCR
uniref:Uncharacterized protein n=1 Tax=Meleagris gallopavo TaxID=9103 RepID=A0A803Y9L0_MELGA